MNIATYTNEAAGIETTVDQTGAGWFRCTFTDTDADMVIEVSFAGDLESITARAKKLAGVR